MTSLRLLDPASATLIKAAEYIEQNGWAQGAFYVPRFILQPKGNDECAHVELRHAACTTGALIRVSQDTDAVVEAAARLARYLDLKQAGPPFMCLQAWNDDGERKASDVTEAMRGAAIDQPKVGRAANEVDRQIIAGAKYSRP